MESISCYERGLVSVSQESDQEACNISHDTNCLEGSQQKHSEFRINSHNSVPLNAIFID